MVTRGDMRDRVRVVRKSRTQRSDGGYTISETTVQERWAHIAPSGGGEASEAGRQHSAVQYTVTVDALGLDCTADDHLLWLTKGDAVLNVRAVRIVRRREMFAEIECETGVIT